MARHGVYEIKILKWDVHNDTKPDKKWIKLSTKLATHHKWLNLKNNARSVYTTASLMIGINGGDSWKFTAKDLHSFCKIDARSVENTLKMLVDAELIQILNAPKTLPRIDKKRGDKRRIDKKRIEGDGVLADNPSQPAMFPRTSKAPTSEAWSAYKEAYRKRYKVDPTWNAKVSGQLKHFVKRVPAAEAPDIAKFYVGHNNPRYVASGHAVGPMLLDAEKLRTEWLRGQKITQQEIRNSDFKDSLQSQLERV